LADRVWRAKKAMMIQIDPTTAGNIAPGFESSKKRPKNPSIMSM
jgi:hypothetical protein